MYIIDMKELDIYVDASYLPYKNNGMCAAFIIDEHEIEYGFKFGLSDVWLREHYGITTKQKLSSLEYEAYALYFILEKFINRKDIKMRIYTDCDSVFNVINGVHGVKESNVILGKIIDSLLKLKEMLITNNIIFELMWVKGHRSIYGNVMADSISRSRQPKYVKFVTGINKIFSTKNLTLVFSLLYLCEVINQ